MHITGYAFIVGGGIAIERACALALAKDGAAGLLIADIDTSAAQETAAQYQETTVSMTIGLFSQMDYCVECADIGPNSHAEIAGFDLFAYQCMLDVNITGTFLVIHQVSGFMRGQEPRQLLSLLVLESAVSHVAMPGVAPYTAAKHAVVGVVKTAAIDNIPHGICINAVCPSFVNTPEEVITKMHLMGCIANAEEVVDAVCFSCSDRSSYMT
ncbi:hypothetical protein BDW67DRAFT_179308 [Aspergillus spinulosporus]